VAEIVWSPQAIEDVESIRDFIGRDSPTYGALVAARLVDSVERLGQFLDSGRVRRSFRTLACERFSGAIIESCTALHGVRSRLLRCFTDPACSLSMSHSALATPANSALHATTRFEVSE